MNTTKHDLCQACELDFDFGLRAIYLIVFFSWGLVCPIFVTSEHSRSFWSAFYLECLNDFFT